MALCIEVVRSALEAMGGKIVAAGSGLWLTAQHWR